MKSERIRHADAKAMLEIAHAFMETRHQPQEASRVLVHGLSRLIDADQCKLGTRRVHKHDGDYGWRFIDWSNTDLMSRCIHAGPLMAHPRFRWPFHDTLAADPRRCHTGCRSRLLPERDERRFPVYMDLVDMLKMGDTIDSKFTPRRRGVGLRPRERRHERVGWMFLGRERGRPAFTERELAIVAHFHASIGATVWSSLGDESA